MNEKKQELLQSLLLFRRNVLEQFSGWTAQLVDNKIDPNIYNVVMLNAD